MYPLDDTIAAIASPPGGAARGIVRTSGPQALKVVRRHFRADRRSELSAPKRPVAIAGWLGLPDLASRLPCEAYLWPEGRSYTGQDVAELHTLGSPPLLEMVLHALCAAGARMAQPGEFTLRAFLAGRIDLTQAEAVLGVVDAADPQQLEVALDQLAGGLTGPLRGLREVLIDLLAQLEAGLDFADEDLPLTTADELDAQLERAAESLAELVRRTASRGETTGPVRAVLAGPPNAGKSSLFNALAGRTAAMVSQQPGTTRDYLEAELDLEGVRCRLVDTAGGRTTAEDASDAVRRAARAAASQQGRRAHVQIHCLDCTRPPHDRQREELHHAEGGRRMVVLTKVDLGEHPDSRPGGLRTSSVTGQGIDSLRAALRRAVLAAGASGAHVVAGTAARCHDSLRLAAEGLRRAREVLRTGRGEELAAAEIRVALAELGGVVGVVYTDDVLDRVFSRFCIGK